MKYRYIYYEYLCLKIMTAAKRPKTLTSIKEFYVSGQFGILVVK